MRRAGFSIVLIAYLSHPSHTTPFPSPQQILDSFVLSRDDLKIELVVSEPAIADPVDIAWDEAGRMFVVEMTDYPNGPGTGRIKLLEDRDSDGSYEMVSVYADDLPFPTSVLPSRAGAYVTAAPNLWYLQDTNGDGVADHKEVVVTGFAEGNQQLRVNGLVWGLDNWIYGANGRSGGSIRTPSMDPSEAISLRNRDFRFHPQNGSLESTSGMSQFGQAHDDFGRRFLSWNTIPIRQVMLEQRYLDRMPSGITADPLAEISDPADGDRLYPLAAAQKRFNRESVDFFNASCGLTIYRGDLLPRELHGDAFVCEPLTSLVHRKKLYPNGSAYLAKREEQGEEFLSSTHPWFRPVNLETGPDGALYIVDFAREWVEHPDFVPENLRDSVDYRIGDGLGRIWKIVPKTPLNPPSTNVHPVHPSPQNWVELLEHPNAWGRETAQRLLVEHGNQAIAPELIALFASSKDPRCRAHCLWSLEGLGILEEKTILAALRDPSPEVRRQALILAEDRTPLSESIRNSFLKMADDGAHVVRLQLALSSRVLSASDRLEICSRLFDSVSLDPWFRWATLSSIADVAVPFLERMAVDGAILAENLNGARIDFLRDLARVVGTRNEVHEIRRFLRVAKPENREDWGAGELALLAGWAEGLSEGGAREFFGGAEFDRVAALFDDTGKPDAIQELAIPLLANIDPDRARGKLIATLSAPTTYSIERVAAGALGQILDASSCELLFEKWDAIPPTSRRLLLARMVASATQAERVFAALESSRLAPSELDLTHRHALRDRPEAQIQRLCEKWFGPTANPARQEVIDRYAAALTLPKTDPENGAQLFSKNCGVCHRWMGGGKRVGPDLSGIGSQPKEKTLADILDPSREVAPDFHQYLIETVSGDIHTGLLAAETEDALILKQADEVETRVPRAEVKEFRAGQMSMMPEGFEVTLTEQDLADLIRFLHEPATEQ